MEIIPRSELPTLDDIRETLTPALRETGALRAIVFGSYARGEARDRSDLDLVIIASVTRKFVTRFKDFWAVIDAWRGGMDLIVYTPAEYQKMRLEDHRFIDLLETEGKVIYKR